jgi:hypothetical protein
MRKFATRNEYIAGVVIALFVLVGTAWAIKPFRSDAGVQMTNQASWQGATGVPGIYYKTSTGLVMRKPDNSEVTLGTGGVTFPISNSTSPVTFSYGGTYSGTTQSYQVSSTNNPSGLGDDFFAWMPAGTTRGSVKYNSGTDNFQIVSPAAFVDFFDNNSSGLRIHNGVDTELLSASVTVITATQASILGSGVNTLGSAATPWPETYSKRYSTPVQAIAAATNLTIGSTNGELIRLSLSATAISTLTVNAGISGERLTVEVIQDATGSRTIPTTWTNVTFAGGTYTATTTASKRDILTFVYDGTSAKWFEMSRAMNL